MDHVKKILKWAEIVIEQTVLAGSVIVALMFDPCAGSNSVSVHDASVRSKYLYEVS